MKGFFSSGEAATAPIVKPLKEGWLKKEGANVKNWKLRYFKLYPNRIEYYKKMPFTGIMSLQGTIDFHDTSTVAVLREERGGNKFIFSVTLPKREYYISADSEQERSLWIDAITDTLRKFKGGKSSATTIGKEMGNVTDVTYPEMKRAETAIRSGRGEGGFSLSSSLPRDGPLARHLSMSAGVTKPDLSKSSVMSDTSASTSNGDTNGHGEGGGGSDDKISRRRSSIFAAPPVLYSSNSKEDKESNNRDSNNFVKDKEGEKETMPTTSTTRSYSATSAERPKGGRVINIDMDFAQIATTGDISHENDAKQKSNKNYASTDTGKGKIERVPYTAYSRERGMYKSSSSPGYDVMTGGDDTSSYPTTSAPSSYRKGGGYEEDSRLLPNAEGTGSCQCCSVM